MTVEELEPVCAAVAGPDGACLLRFLRDIYHQRPAPAYEAYSEATVAQTLRLGLIDQPRPPFALTSAGYLVGNVAKEYHNWIDSGRRMPPPRPPDELIAGRDVLDLGCSFGRWIWEFSRQARSVVGLEFQPEYVQLGRALAACEGLPPPDIRVGSAEDLDRYFPQACFDFVFCRLMLNHVAIRSTLGRIAGVLRSGGTLWVQVESLGSAVQKLLHGERRWRSRAFAGFALINSLVCMATNHQLNLRVQGRMHSAHRPAYPSTRWWQKAAAAEGLDAFKVRHERDSNLTFSVRRRGLGLRQD